MSFDPGSRSLLTARDRGRFPGETLFERIARAVCDAECLPRKELYESWEVARRARRRLRGGRVVDLAGGHGLTAAIALLLDGTSPSAHVIDRRIPASAETLRRALSERFPALGGRIAFEEAELETMRLGSDDLAIAVHACGALSDRVLDLALEARAGVALLPCCHDRETCDAGGLDAWMELGLAVDSVRATRLRAAGYETWLQTIPAAITPKNRLLVGRPQ